MDNLTNSNTESNNQIDIFSIIRIISNSKLKIFFITVICLVIGYFLGLVLPEKYIASSSFIPQSPSSNNETNISSQFNLQGFILGSQSNNGNIPPNLYYRILQSESFRKQILDSKIYFQNDTISYREYLKRNQSDGYFFAEKLIFEHINNDVIKPDSIIYNSTNQPIFTSPIEYNFQKIILDRITIEFDRKESIVNITANEKDPLIAAQLVIITEDILKKWITNIELEKSNDELKFIEDQLENTEREFYNAQADYYTFIDKNINLSTNYYSSDLNRLKTKFELLSSLQLELSKKKLQAEIEVNKNTPIFTSLNPVSIPQGKSSPDRKLILLISFFSGLVFSLISIFFNFFYGKILENYINSKVIS